ncbi:MAG: NUDIX hydrolase [Deltaproteobacteria bacterium]|nr:NUDIX hydrolase [Deltaproteobacteria bacterium]
MEESPWKTTASQNKYENRWISVTEHSVVHQTGGPGIYGVVHFKHLAIGIVPIDEQGFTWLVGQYRYPLSAYSWEIPEGGGALDIPPIESAQRELKEETGIEAAHWQEILQMHLSNSATDERAIVYLATGLSMGASKPEDDETLEVKKVKFEEALAMVLRGEITDAISVAALLKVARMRGT